MMLLEIDWSLYDVIGNWLIAFITIANIEIMLRENKHVEILTQNFILSQKFIYD